MNCNSCSVYPIFFHSKWSVRKNQKTKKQKLKVQLLLYNHYNKYKYRNAMGRSKNRIGHRDKRTLVNWVIVFLLFFSLCLGHGNVKFTLKRLYAYSYTQRHTISYMYVRLTFSLYFFHGPLVWKEKITEMPK